MSLITVELNDPRQPVRVPDDAVAAGIVVLQSGCPAQFLLRPARPGEIIPSDTLQRWIDSDLAAVRTAVPASSAQPGKTLTIAVCTKERPEWAARCLDSILQVCADAPEVDILLIDNAPVTDQTRDLVAARPRVRYVREPVPGLNFARSRALREARGELLAFLDDDVVLAPSWLAGVRAAWQEHPDAGGLVGPIFPYELVTPAQYRFEWRGGFGRRFAPARHVHPGVHLPLHPNRVFGAGANMIFLRSALEAVGGFDPALDTGAPLPGGGDLDILYRVQRAGYPFLNEPLCAVFHQHRRTHRQLQRQMWTWGLSMTAYLNKIYNEDPLARPVIRQHFRQYFFHQWYTLAVRLTRPHVWPSYPPDLILAEIAGALVALTGSYGRSVRRSQRLLQKFASA